MVEQEAAEDQRVKLLISSSVPYQSVASCSLMSFPTFFDSLQHQRGIYSSTTTTLADQALLCNQRADKVLWQGETSCDQVCTSESLLHHVVDVDKDEYYNKLSLYADKINLERQYERNINKPVKYWTSSKKRLMQKMTSQQDQIPDPKIALDYKFQSSVHHDGHQHQENNIGETSNSSLTISNNNSSSSSTSTVCAARVCSDCSTNTTPLWRSGPRGPKSLCNACGIRQRKARRAMVQAGAAASANGFAVGTTDPTTATTAASLSMNKEGKEKKSQGNDHNVSVRCKNKRKLIMTDVSASTASYKYHNRKNKQLCDFEQLSAFPPSVLFPQDVAEAAILLMELSCGLINHS